MNASHYRIFQIPKGNGFRTIAEPLPKLKNEQQNILKWMHERGIRPGKYAHGFIRGKSILSNANRHTGKAIVIRIDLKDFFPSISRTRVLFTLMNLGLERETATYIAERCTLDDYLPQGAPTSPYLANLVANKLDHRLTGYVRKSPLRAENLGGFCI